MASHQSWSPTIFDALVPVLHTFRTRTGNNPTGTLAKDAVTPVISVTVKVPVVPIHNPALVTPGRSTASLGTTLKAPRANVLMQPS